MSWKQGDSNSPSPQQGLSCIIRELKKSAFSPSLSSHIHTHRRALLRNSFPGGMFGDFPVISSGGTAVIWPPGKTGLCRFRCRRPVRPRSSTRQCCCSHSSRSWRYFWLRGGNRRYSRSYSAQVPSSHCTWRMPGRSPSMVADCPEYSAVCPIQSYQISGQNSSKKV